MDYFGRKTEVDSINGEVAVGQGTSITTTRGGSFGNSAGGTTANVFAVSFALYARTSDANTADISISIYEYDPAATVNLPGDGAPVNLLGTSATITLAGGGSDIDDLVAIAEDFTCELKVKDYADVIMVVNVITATAPVFIGVYGEGVSGNQQALRGDGVNVAVFVPLINTEYQIGAWVNIERKATDMTTFNDTFSGEVADVLLTTHTADTGQSWKNLAAATYTEPEIKFAVDEVGQSDANKAMGLGDVTVIDNDYELYWTRTNITNISGQKGAGVCLRYSDTILQGYLITSYMGNNELRLVRQTAGSGVTIATFSHTQPISVSQDYKITIATNGLDVDFEVFASATEGGALSSIGTYTDTGVASVFLTQKNFGLFIPSEIDSQIKSFTAIYDTVSTRLINTSINTRINSPINTDI